jgi:hypothetical protein
MSNISAGRSGVSTAQVVVFILLILASGVAAYVFHTEISNLDTKLAKERETLSSNEKSLAEALARNKALYDALGFSSVNQIEEVFATSRVQLSPGAPDETGAVRKWKTLEKLVAAKFAVRDRMISELGVDPKTVEETGQSPLIRQVIDQARQSGAVPDALKNTKLGKLAEQVVRLDKVLAEREGIVTAGESALTAVNQNIAAVQDETTTKFTERDAAAAQVWKERETERDKLRFEPVKWAAEGEVLEKDLQLEQAINRKIERKLRAQRDMFTPVDGKIVAYDWKTGRGTVNLGASDNVKPGYEFDVYRTRPGRDRADKRLYHGRLRLLNVHPDTSLFTPVPSEWDNQDQPVMTGDLVCSQIYDPVTRKTFVLKGWFPQGSDYSKTTLAGMIFRDGGIVKDELTLDTDYLLVGIMSEEGLASPSEEAKKAVAEGAKAYEDARHWYVPVLTVEKFFKYMNRTGTTVAQ